MKDFRKVEGDSVLKHCTESVMSLGTSRKGIIISSDISGTEQLENFNNYIAISCKLKVPDLEMKGFFLYGW